MRRLFNKFKELSMTLKVLTISGLSFGCLIFLAIFLFIGSAVVAGIYGAVTMSDTEGESLNVEQEVENQEEIIEEDDIEETEDLEKDTEPENNKADFQIEAEANSKEHPATPGKKLYGEEFKGMNYHFKGELIKAEQVEGLFGNVEEALLVKNDEGFILVIFPNYEIPVDTGDEVEIWGPLSGDGYASSDLGVDNVVGVTGAINATRIDVNGEMQ